MSSSIITASSVGSDVASSHEAEKGKKVDACFLFVFYFCLFVRHASFQR